VTRFAKASCGVLLFGGMAMGQQGNTWFQQWYRAKYGSPPPAEQARAKAEAASTAYRQDTSPRAPAPTWTEQWFRAKYGINTPAEEARLREERANTAYRQDTTKRAQDPNEWLRGFMRSKYGRDIPSR
jgi:hypothetical protein